LTISLFRLDMQVNHTSPSRLRRKVIVSSLTGSCAPQLG